MFVCNKSDLCVRDLRLPVFQEFDCRMYQILSWLHLTLGLVGSKISIFCFLWHILIWYSSVYYKMTISLLFVFHNKTPTVKMCYPKQWIHPEKVQFVVVTSSLELENMCQSHVKHMSRRPHKDVCLMVPLSKHSCGL